MLPSIIFREYSKAPSGCKLLSFFTGLGYAAYATGYKISQCARNYKTNFTNMFGEEGWSMMIQATGGSLMGIGKVVLLPLDVLKIKQQINPDAIRGRGVIKIFMEEGMTP